MITDNDLGKDIGRVLKDAANTIYGKRSHNNIFAGGNVGQAIAGVLVAKEIGKIANSIDTLSKAVLENSNQVKAYMQMLEEQRVEAVKQSETKASNKEEDGAK